MSKISTSLYPAFRDIVRKILLHFVVKTEVLLMNRNGIMLYSILFIEIIKLNIIHNT
jgi:hypothetical protein